MWSDTRYAITRTAASADSERRPVEMCEHKSVSLGAGFAPYSRLAGKNAIAHVGKLYNVLAFEAARAVARAEPSIDEVSVQILSTLGRPVSQPALAAIDLRTRGSGDAGCERVARDIVNVELGRIGDLSMRLIRGEVPVF